MSKVKDVDFIILNMLNDEDLLNICKIKNKYIQELCKNETFWRNRFSEKFGKEIKGKEIKDIKEWKNFYLGIVHYSKYSPAKIMKEISKKGRKDLIDFFIEDNHYLNKGLYGAAIGGHRDLIDFFIEKGAQDWISGLCGAAQKGDQDLVNFFIEKGDRDINNYWDNEFWDYGLKDAAKGGHRDLVEFFIEKGAGDWNMGMEGAARGGYRDLVEFFIEKGADYWQGGMINAARGGHIDLVDFFIGKKNIKKYDKLKYFAAKGGMKNINLINYCFSKGTREYKYALMGATDRGHEGLVTFLKRKQNEKR